MKLLTTITLPQLVDVASWLARGVEHDSSSCCLMLLPLGSISLCGDTVFITSVLVSYRSAALDEKTPILPANATLDKR
jgi:glutamine synthetase type III